MREYRFRAWNNLEKKYGKAEDYVVRLTGEVFNRETGEEVYYIDLEQYIGLKDINGKEIFECDRCQLKGWNVCIKWSDDLCLFYVYYTDNDMKGYLIGIGDIYKTSSPHNIELEIIGTIHDQEASSHDA